MCIEAFVRALHECSSSFEMEPTQVQFVHEALCELNDTKRRLCHRISPNVLHVYKDLFLLQHGGAHDFVADGYTVPDRPDIIAVGFSCKDLSTMHNGPGQMKRFSGKKHTSISTFEASAVCAETWQSDLIIMENVKALLCSRHIDKGIKPIDTVDERLRRGGFLGAHKLLDAKDFGLPQRRGRVWLVYFRCGRGEVTL